MNKAPEFLGKTGRKKWHELRKLIPNPTSAQDDMCTMLASAWEAYLQAGESVKKDGQVIKVAGSDRLFVNPSCNILETERKAIMRISKALGLHALLTEIEPTSEFENLLP